MANAPLSSTAASVLKWHGDCQIRTRWSPRVPQVAALQAEAERQAAEVARLHATTPQQLCGPLSAPLPDSLLPIHGSRMSLKS